jgi:hypothetical protein
MSLNLTFRRVNQGGTGHIAVGELMVVDGGFMLL